MKTTTSTNIITTSITSNTTTTTANITTTTNYYHHHYHYYYYYYYYYCCLFKIVPLLTLSFPSFWRITCIRKDNPLKQRPTEPATKFYTVTPNISGIITAVCSVKYKNVCHFTCTEQKASDNSDVYRSVQNCGAAVWSLLHVTFLTHKIWTWFSHFSKICGPLL